MSRETKRFDAAKYIKTPAAERQFLNDALETGHAGHIARALGVIARARGITSVSKDTGLTRATLYASLSENGNPTLETVLSITKALGFNLSVTLQSPAKSEAQKVPA